MKETSAKTGTTPPSRLQPAVDGTVDVRRVFHSFAAKAVKDFPVLEGELAIYDTTRNRLYGCYDNAAQPLLRFTARAHSRQAPEGTYAVAVRSEDVRKMGGILSALAGTDNNADKRHSVITWMRDVQTEDEAVALSTLRHELGHLVTPVTQNSNLNESIADAFGALYRPDDGTPLRQRLDERSQKTAALLALTGETNHFSLPTLQALDTLSRQQDLSALTPPEMADLAFRVAQKSVLSQSALKRLAAIFAPAQKAFADPETAAADVMQACVRIMNGDHGKDTALVAATARGCILAMADDEALTKKQRAALLKAVAQHNNKKRKTTPQRNTP